ncbi:MAG: sigma-70 family RNA polymerase sigma factor [Planctomycetaceae bacterium]|nr:sigma-70 family RNA polymerase sigma factor [Planctomycetaceae bacterium]
MAARDGRDVGRLLESFRPYLAAIAQAEFPSGLAGKLGTSDVVQDTIIKGLERFPQFQGSTREEFARWLRAILRNHIANVIETFSAQKRDVGREKPGHAALIDPWQSSPSGIALSREERDRLDAALACLPDEPRRVILLRHRDDQTFAEIGEAIGKTEEAARKVWVRAVEKLQQALDRASG